MGPGSNLGRSLRIERVRVKGRAGRGGAVAGALLRGGGVTGVGKSGASEPGLGHGLVQKNERGMRDTTGPKSGLGRCLGGAGLNGGGLARRSTPASGIPALDWGLGDSIASAKGKGRFTGSH